MNITYVNTTNQTLFFNNTLIDKPKAAGNFFNLLIIFFIFKFLGHVVDETKITKKITEKFIKKKPLDNVIGLESVKEELHYYMDFINNSDKYKNWEVKLPKGILLAGPPGTGKTLLVKTIAKSLKIPIESACGSEFVEKYVGVGASRVRSLFAKAKRVWAGLLRR